MSVKPVKWIPREQEWKQLGFKVSPEFAQRLDDVCKSSDISKTAFIKLAVSQLMSKMA